MPPLTMRLRFPSFRSLALASLFVLGGAAAFTACDSEYPPEAFGTGGNTQQSTGGAPSTGGAATGGNGGTGGVSNTGGSATGGATGGSATGGSATGGSATGGGGGHVATGGMGAGGRTGGAGGGSGSCASTTYANFGMAFLKKYCVACHSGFSSQAGAKSSSANIKAMAASGTIMPPSSAAQKPTAAERTQLGAWIDCGAM